MMIRIVQQPLRRPVSSRCWSLSTHARMQAARSRHGKMEKSLLSFATQYPMWEPESAAKQLLTTLSVHQHHPLHASPHFPYTAFAEQLQPAMAPGASPAAGLLLMLAYMCHSYKDQHWQISHRDDFPAAVL